MAERNSLDNDLDSGARAIVRRWRPAALDVQLGQKMGSAVESFLACEDSSSGASASDEAELQHDTRFVDLDFFTLP